MGMFLWYGYEKSLLERGKSLMNHGFTSASLWWEKEGERTPLENLRELRALGLDILHAHLPFSEEAGLWISREKRKRFVDSMLLWLEELHEGEIAIAIFHPSIREEIGLPYHEEGLYAFERIHSRAKTLGVELAVENLISDDHFFVLLEHFSHLPICFDTGHLGVSGNWERIKPYLSRVKALHLHDNDGKKDLHRIPGDGILELEQWLRYVPEDVPLHLEISSYFSEIYKEMGEDTFLRRAKLSLERLKENRGK